MMVEPVSRLWRETTAPEWWNGRHDGLKIRCPQGREGSSPSSGTAERRCRTLGDLVTDLPRLVSRQAAAQVVTVDESGTITGVADVRDVHRPPGQLHLAVSVQLVDEDDRWIVQRRAASKLIFPSFWANSCCTHPKPGEALHDAASRRVSEELGFRVLHLEHCGSFVYNAYDAVSGMVEHELDHVYVGRVAGAARPAVTEVDELAQLSLRDAATLFAAHDAAPWAREVLAFAAAV
jgi:isopentenyl-diphosphate Delta-isomerase